MTITRFSLLLQTAFVAAKLPTQITDSGELALRVVADVTGFEDHSSHYESTVNIQGRRKLSALVFQSLSKPFTNIRSNPDPVTGECGYYTAYNHTQSWINFELGTKVPVEVVVSISSPEITLNSTGGELFSVQMIPPEGAEAQLCGEHNAQVCIEVSAPGQYYLEINDQATGNPTWTDNGEQTYSPVHTFLIFANPLQEGPDKSDPKVRVVRPGNTAPEDFDEDVLYFYGGVHHLPGRYVIGNDRGMYVRSNKRYYVAADAVLYGGFTNGDVAENITIDGYGTMAGNHFLSTCDPKIPDGGKQLEKAILMQPKGGAKNVTIRGISLFDFPGHAMALSGDFLKVSWIKVLSWRRNGDGVDVLTRHTVADGAWSLHLHDSFLRCSDDTFYLEPGLRYDRIRLWNDAHGHTIRIGGWPSQYAYPGPLAPCLLSNVDVILKRSATLHWAKSAQNVIAMKEVHENAMDILDVRNVRVWDRHPSSPLFSLRGSEIGPRGNWTFTNVHSAGFGDWHPMNQFVGKLDVTLNNVTIAGIPASALVSNASLWQTDSTVRVTINDRTFIDDAHVYVV